MRRISDFEKEVVNNLVHVEKTENFGMHPFSEFLAKYFGKDKEAALLVKDGKAIISLHPEDTRTFGERMTLFSFLEELVEQKLIILLDHDKEGRICLGQPREGETQYPIPEPINGFVCMAAGKMLLVTEELRQFVTNGFITPEPPPASAVVQEAPHEEAIKASRHAVKLSLELGIGSIVIATASFLIAVAALFV